MFGSILPVLAERHQVIAVDLQGHGRTADVDRPLDIRPMADDIVALIDHLELDQPDLMGYSLGGGVALVPAAKFPRSSPSRLSPSWTTSCLAVGRYASGTSTKTPHPR